MVEIPMEGVLFLLSGIAIIHFDDMQKIHPFTYLPNKFLETRSKDYGNQKVYGKRHFCNGLYLE